MADQRLVPRALLCSALRRAGHGGMQMVFVERLENQIAAIEAVPVGCKFGGATGGLAAHYVAYPSIDWCAHVESPRTCACSIGMRYLRSSGSTRGKIAASPSALGE